MSFSKWCISTFFVFFFFLTFISSSWCLTRPTVGISPISVSYPSSLSWVSFFLQEELTHQLALSKSVSLRSPHTIQLWNSKLNFINKKRIEFSLLEQIRVDLFIKIKLQKVVEHASIKGTLFIANVKNQSIQTTDFKSIIPWTSPDIVVQAIIQKLASLLPQLSKITFYPQQYSWQSLEAFYQWKLQPLKMVGSPEWQQYKTELESLLSHYPDIARLIHAELASLLLLEGAQPNLNNLILKQAEDSIKEAIRLDPKNDQFHAILSLIYYLQDDKVSSKSQSVIANAYNPENALAQVLYGFTIGQTLKTGEKFILLGLEKDPFLIDYFKFANRNFPVYEALFPYLSKWTTPTEPTKTILNKYDLALKEGIILFKQKKFEEARPKFELATALNSSQIAPLLFLARISLSKKMYEETIQFLSEIKDQFPQNAQLFYYLGISYEALKSYDQAEIQYRQAIFFKQNYPQALLRLSITLMRLEQLDEAQNFLEALTSKYPKYSNAWWNLGVLFSIKGDWENANNVLLEALRLDPDNTKIQKRLDKIKTKLK